MSSSFVDLLRSGVQGASNAAASNVSGPVDLLAWLLRKGGVPVPSNAFGGSEWMRQQGLTAEPKNKLAGMLGEGVGLAAPFAIAAKAPQIAGAMNKADDALTAGANRMADHFERTGAGFKGPPDQRGAIVFHGTRNPGAIDGLVGRPGGLKMMDGLGPHVGTAEAANERLLKNNGIKNWNKPTDAAEGAYIMPLDLQPTKEFAKQGGVPYTETELQSRLSALAEKLGFSKADTRAYSSAYGASAKMKQAQMGVRDYLRQQGYDAIPYVNSHEARGSTSYVVLDPERLKPLFEANALAAALKGPR